MSKIRVNTVVNRTSNDKVTFPFGIGVTNGVVCSGVVTATAFVGSGVSLTGVRGETDIEYRDGSAGLTGITTIRVGAGLTVSLDSAGIVTFTSGGVNVSAGGDGVNSDRINVSGVATVTDINVSNNLQVTGITTLGDTVVNSSGEVIIQNLDRVMMGGVDGAGAPLGFVARYNSGTATELSNISGLPFVFGDGNVTDFATISVGGIDVGSGIVTAASFDGELSGNLSGSINASGISTIQNLHITEALLATGVSIGTVRTLQSETLLVSGIATATSFDGPATGLSGTPNIIVGHSTHYSIEPSADNTYDLGANNKRWANIYSADMHFSNKGDKNSVDGTWGDWTLQEGHEDIFMLNNRTGKKFKINLTEV